MLPRRAAFLAVMLAVTAEGGVLSWTSAGPETAAVTVVRFDPANPSIVWAGTQSAGIFRSADGGVTWEPRKNGLIAYPISAIAVDPTNSSVVYAAGGPSVFKTTSAGEQWAPASTGLFAGGARVTDLVIDPSAPATLYVSTTSDAVNPSLGVQKSTNGGASWSDSGGASLGTKNVYALAIDRQNPSTIYAGGFFDNSDRPLFKSTNGGASWVSVSTGLTGFSIDAIATDPLVGGTVLVSRAGSVQRSTNGGTSWTGASGLPFSTVGNAIVYEPDSSSNVWYATASDVFRSTNGGASWTAAKIANAWVNGLDVSADGLVVAGTADSGIYRRTASASAWEPASTGLRGARVLAVAASSKNGVVHAGTDETGMFRSNDHGLTWERPTTQFLRSRIEAVVIDPEDPLTVYAGIDGSGGFYKSTDGGTRWGNQAFLSGVRAIAIDPVVRTTIYAGTDNGVYKSTNGGTAFVAASSGLPSFTAVLAIAVHPVSTMTVWAALSGQGVYRSTDGGATWTKKSSGLTDPDVEEIVLDPGQPSRLYAATNGGGVFRSSDGGESWAAANSGLGTLLVRSLSIDADEPQKMYAGTTGNGVYASSDGATTWTQLGGTSPASGIVGLAAGARGDIIHAAATGGVWSYQFAPFDARVTVTFPAQGGLAVNGTRVEATWENFVLDCAASSSNQGRGIWRVDVDGALDAIGCGLTAKLTRTYPPGPHRITFSLRNPDGSALNPPAQSSVDVTFVDRKPRRRGVRK